jgi:hypothetical protein
VVDVHAATAPAIVDAATGAVEYAWTSIDWSDSDCADDAK